MQRKQREWMSSVGAGDAKSKSALGFLTVIEDPRHGLFGGYLVLDVAGRPLEFHCTAPVKPNRAQQILYGPTLEPYLFGEQIGRALLGKATIEPLLVCTDCRPAMAVRDHVCVPVALVLPSEDPAPPESGPARGDRLGEEPNSEIRRVDGPHGTGLSLAGFRLGRNRLAVPVRFPDDRQLIVNRLGKLAEAFDLGEPFERIRQAIEEARRGGQ